MKILFVVGDFDCGGITSALRNLSNMLVERGHSVDILNFSKVEKLPQDFDERIQLLEIGKRAKLWNFGIQDAKKEKGIKKIGLYILGLYKKVLSRRKKWWKFVFAHMPIMEGYDIAAGFRQGPMEYYFVSHKTNAKRRVGFWHGDPDFLGDTSGWDQCVYEVDNVIGVSNALCEKLVSHYPKLAGKVKTVYNVFNANEIRKLGNIETRIYSSKQFNIVTVARIDFEQKKLQMIPNICRQLKKEGLKFTWTIVGGGNDFNALKNMISQDISDTLFLVGEKSNPYPYISQADIFVLTSIWETYGMVVMEALILGTPVIAGDYPALAEILEDKVTGIIAENSEQGISREISFVMKNKETYNKLKQNCQQFEYSEDLTYQQFIRL